MPVTPSVMAAPSAMSAMSASFSTESALSSRLRAVVEVTLALQRLDAEDPAHDRAGSGHAKTTKAAVFERRSGGGSAGFSTGLVR